MPPLEPDRQKLTQLRKLLIQHFSLDELRVLCFDLGLEYEDLPGDTRTTKMHGLVEYLQRRGELHQMLNEVIDHRPNVAWPTFSDDSTVTPKDKADGGQFSASYVHEKTGLEMLLIPAGEFLYGEEKELRFLPNYWMAKTPVTNDHYAKFVRDVGYKAPDHWENGHYPVVLANHPVVKVSWYDAAAYAEWSGLQLPTEQQWEKAARGLNGRKYPWGNEWKLYCNSWEAGNGKTTPIGYYSSFGDSPYGCVDMSGNVWEWTDSWYDDKKEKRCLRGGAFYTSHRFCNVAFRSDYFALDIKLGSIGFRVAENS